MNRRYCIVTGYDDDQKKLGDFSSAINMKMASEEGHDFYCFRTKSGDHPTSWEKIYVVRDMLMTFKYDAVFWVDADAIVLRHGLIKYIEENMSISDEFVCQESEEGEGTGVPNFGLFYTQNCSATLDSLNLIISLKGKYLNDPHWEQSAAKQLMKEGNINVKVFPYGSFWTKPKSTNTYCLHAAAGAKTKLQRLRNGHKGFNGPK